MLTMRRTENILEEYRQRKNFSQEEFANKLGMSRSYIAGVLTGSRNPSKKTLEKMFEVLGIEDTIKAEIELYEAFKKAPPLVQYNFFDMQSQLAKKDIEIESYKMEINSFKRLEKFKSIMDNYYFELQNKKE